MPSFYAVIECKPLNLEVGLYSLKNQPYVRISPKDYPDSHFFVFENQRNRDLVRSFARHNGYAFRELTEAEMRNKHFEENNYTIVGDKTLIPGMASV